MKKSSFGAIVTRGLITLAVCFFGFMLYWSSVSQEKTLIEIREQLSQIKRDVKKIETSPKNAQSLLTASISSARLHINPDLPNVLIEDPFYEKTLPEMLGKDFSVRGVFNSSTLGKPNNLLPLSGWLPVTDWNAMCTISVAKGQFGIYEKLCPYAAIKMEERGEQEYWIHLREGLFWEPLKKEFFPDNFELNEMFLERHPVTAYDFKFFLDILMNPFNQESGALPLRSYLGDIEELRVIDDLTFVVKWKQQDVKQLDGSIVKKKKYIAKLLTGGLTPVPRHVYQYFSDGSKIIENDEDPETYRTNSVWAQNFREHWAKNIIISCGPYLFDGMNEREIKFIRNPNFYLPLAVLAEGSLIEFKDSTDNIWQNFKLGLNDTHTLAPSELLEFADFIKSPVYQKQPFPIKKLEFLAHSYNYIGWNQTSPLFASSKVRRALTMAIDRRRIIDKNLNGLGEEIHGTFFIQSPSSDPNITPWPFDPQAAKRLLEEEGWYDSDGDGIIDKEIGGKRVPFSFSLTYFVKNGTSKSVSEYVVSALKEIGIDCRLNGVDVTDLSAAVEEKSFEAVYMGWGLGTPPEDPNQLWFSKWAKEKGSSNLVGFANPEADRIINELEFESDPDTRLKLYHAFDKIMHEEQPYTFLYSPKTIMLYRSYLQNVFIPIDRQDLVPGANVTEPDSSIYWLKK